jgi:hypothetical protein
MAKVVRFHELGSPEVLCLEEITFEDPAPGEALRQRSEKCCRWSKQKKRSQT